MTDRQRFVNALNNKATDRLPVIEWATWWDLTLNRWQGEGVNTKLPSDDFFKSLNLDVHRQYWLRNTTADCPQPKYHGAGIIENEDDYERILPYLYPKDINRGAVNAIKGAKDTREHILWYSLEGAFWFPRTLFGIEGHLFSFYDCPQLYKRIVSDLCEYQLSQIKIIYEHDTPEFMTFAEDMSYNLGPMLSEDMFNEFLAPYYQRLIPYIHAYGTKVIIDSDGDITKMLPWLINVGIDGVLPLERQAGVDVNVIKKQYKDFILIGGFDKMVMKLGREAMEHEFLRLLPAMKEGKFIPSVDHQTPPDVSFDNYKIYTELLHKYAYEAVK